MAFKEVSNTELKEMVERYKRNGDRTMSFREFIKMLWALIDYFEREIK